MAKRFTETAKWDDPWFRGLPPEMKLAWGYLCDKCDAAGAIELDTPLAEFQIGAEVDWDRFVEASGGRVERLENGRLWLTKFVDFQYGKLSESCPPHRPAIQSLKKHRLTKVLERYQIPFQKVLEKEKDKNKEKTGKGDARGKTKCDPIEAATVPVPDGFEIPSVRQAIGDWLAYKAKRGEAYRDPGYLGRKVAEFARAGPEAFVAAVNSSIGSNYSGLFPAKDANGRSQKTLPGPGQIYDGT